MPFIGLGLACNAQTHAGYRFAPCLGNLRIARLAPTQADPPDFELYGKSIEGAAAAGGAFVPGIGWPIVGMIVGGWPVAVMERENRAWAQCLPFWAAPYSACLDLA